MSTIIPAEYFGLYGLGESAKDLGGSIDYYNQRREQKQQLARQNRREDVSDAAAQDRLKIEKEAAATAKEEAAINKAVRLMQITGDREGALTTLKVAGVSPADMRVVQTLPELLDEKTREALNTPITARNDEQQVLAGNAIGLPAGLDAKQARVLAERQVQQSGLELNKLIDDVTVRDQYREYLKGKGYSEGGIRAHLDFLGIGKEEQDRKESEARIKLMGAQANEAGAQADYYRADGGRQGNTFLEHIAQTQVDELVKNGVPVSIAVKAVTPMMTGKESTLTDEEAQHLAAGYQRIIAGAKETGDNVALLNAVTNAKRANLISGAPGAALIVKAMNEAAGAEIATLTPRRGILGGEKTPIINMAEGAKEMFKINIDTAKAVKSIGGDPALPATIAAEVAASTDLDAEWEGAQALAKDNPLRPLLLDAIAAERERRGGGSVGDEDIATKTPTNTPAAQPTPAATGSLQALDNKALLKKSQDIANKQAAVHKADKATSHPTAASKQASKQKLEALRTEAQAVAKEIQARRAAGKWSNK